MPGDPTFHENHEYIDALRASRSDAAAVVAAMSSNHPDRPAGKGKQRPERHKYDAPIFLKVEVHHPGASIGRFLVLACNLSDGGVGFLNGAFLYPGTQCTITLKTLDDEGPQVTGKIVHCNCVTGRVHYVGVEFDQSIDVFNFVRNQTEIAKAQILETSVQNYDALSVINLAQQIRILALEEAPLSSLHVAFKELGQVLRGSPPKTERSTN